MRRLLPEPADLPDDAALAAAYRLPGGRSLRVNFVASIDGAVTVDGLVLAITPGPAPAVLVASLAARTADHARDSMWS